MQSFEELASQRDRKINECENFIQQLKNKPNSKSLILLLNLKIRTYNSLNYNDYNEITEKLKQIDEEIYREIYLLKYSSKEPLCECANTFLQQKSTKIKFEIILEIYELAMRHKWLTTIAFFTFGILIFLSYFIQIGYIPNLTETNPITILETLAILGFILLIIPIFSLGYIAFLYRHNKKWFVLFTAFIFTACLLLIFPFNISTEYSQISESSPIVFVILIVFIVAFIETFLLMIFAVDILIKYPIVVLCIIVLVATIMFLVQNFALGIICCVGVLLFWLFVTSNNTDKSDIKYILFAFILIMYIFFPSVVSKYVISFLNYGNKNYAAIVFDRNITMHLPKEICVIEQCDKFNDANLSKASYATTESNVTTLHNVKVLSMLGKFYYLQMGNRRFEIEASFIKAKY